MNENAVVTILSFPKENKDLLDNLVEEYELFLGEGASYTLTSPYSVFYWLCRYSNVFRELKNKGDGSI